MHVHACLQHALSHNPVCLIRHQNPCSKLVMLSSADAMLLMLCRHSCAQVGAAKAGTDGHEERQQRKVLSLLNRLTPENEDRILARILNEGVSAGPIQRSLAAQASPSRPLLLYQDVCWQCLASVLACEKGCSPVLARFCWNTSGAQLVHTGRWTMTRLVAHGCLTRLGMLVLQQVFEKGAAEPTFGALYAKLAKGLAAALPGAAVVPGADSGCPRVSFADALLARCLEGFGAERTALLAARAANDEAAVDAVGSLLRNPCPLGC